MVQNQERRGRGRPPSRTDEETRRLLAAAATAEFTRHGYAGTNMCTVASAAGVSTRTLYRLVPTKAELFELIVSERIDTFLLAIENEAIGSLPMDEALERILVEFGKLTLSADVAAINRLMVAESDRFPELAARYHQRAVSRVGRALADWLERQCELKRLTLDDPQIAVGMLRGMMIMEPQRALLLRQAEPPTAAEIEDRARVCARLFLDGCRAGGRARTTADT
jgi:AcrR family transcriptional regulator